MGKNIFLQYLEWHFLDVPKSIFQGWLNFLRFNLSRWSIPILLKTLFSHWRRYKYSYGRGFDFKRYFEVFTFNMMSRGIGFILRVFCIFLGILTELFLVAAGIIVLLFWIVLPLLIFVIFIYGVKILL